MQTWRRLRPLVVALITGASVLACGASSPAPTATTSTATTPSATTPGTTTSTATTRPPLPPPRQPPPALLGREWDRVPTSRHVVALTFDAGANDAGLGKILSALAAQHVPATFFLTAQWVTAHPAGARTVCARYRVGDHSSTHEHFPAMTDAQIRADVLGAADRIRRDCGADPWPMFRFPFGDRDARTIAAVNAAGYVPVGWTVDTLGWQGTSGGRTVASVTRRVLDALQPGEIVLMHVGGHPTDHSTLDADALPTILDRLRSSGYGFVSLDALMATG